MIKLIFIYVTDIHLYFCTSLYGTSHLSLCIATARQEILLWVWYWYVVYIQTYIEIRHGNHLCCCTSLYDVYASRITFCIVVRHCMMCHAFDDSNLYCVLFHLPHFYFCGCGVHHSTPGVWHAFHPFLSCSWWRLAHFILGHRIQQLRKRFPR